MSKLYKILLVIAVVCGVTIEVSAQTYWTPRSDNSGIITDKAVSRQAYPKSFKLFALNLEPLKQQLFTVTDNAIRHTVVISLPNADGGIEQFEVVEASNFAPALQAQFPQIRAFSGKGITDKYATLKLSISPQGIQTMVFRVEKPNEYIEPYSKDHTIYSVFRSQRNKGALPWLCSTPEQQLAATLNSRVSQIESNAGELKTIRLAQSCNGEYANYFGAFSPADVALVLTAYNNTLTRCNGCYEKDLALHLNLIPETVNVIFYDPATDPYTTMANWNNQLQATLTAIIGEPNYDIGHMFGASGGGGNAGCIGCVCVDGIKGRGITSPADAIPMGDNFDIDYVAHEVGHQLGGNHTFTFSGSEISSSTKEVGSGITIMGYAGITNQDVAPHSIDIFHEETIKQIQNNLAIKTCPITTNITANNGTPTVNPVGNYTIPITTPFALIGTATDPNPGDVLTYCWEQDNTNNSTTTGNNSVAFPTKLVGPNWLTFPAAPTGTRLMPRLSTILAGLSITPVLPGGDPIANIEALSSVARTLNFRLTVRDNVPYSSTPPLKIGQTNFTDMVVTVSSAVGPFLITSQNSATSWPASSTQTVTWSVNGTTGPPTNTANVNILFSTDGGNTFTMVLPNTPNDGTEDIVVPGTLTTTGRIKVEAIGNIYFDINNASITVTPAPGGFTFNSPAPVVSSCPAAATLSTSITATFNGTFTNPITLSATAFPAGTNVTFGTNPLTTGTPTSTVNLNNANILTPGSYTVTVQGTATGAATQTRDIIFTINASAGPAITVHPSNQTICVGNNTSFTVTSPTATSFQWQVSTDGGANYTNVTNGGVYAGATTATLTLTNVPASFNTYRYRAIASVQCGSTTSTAAILTVNSAAAITGHPQDITLCAGSTHTFSATATGTGLTYQWQESTDGGTIYNNLSNGGIYSGVNTANLTLTGITAGMNNYKYRVVVTGSGACPAPVTSNPATLTVVTSVTVTLQPVNQTICAGGNTSFTVAGSGPGVIYQWQVNTGSGFVNVVNGGVYSGATTNTLTITGGTVSMNGYLYRAQLSNSTCTTPGISDAVTLTVNTLPAISTQPANSTICLGGNTSFTSTGTGTGIGYQWQVNTGAGFVNVTNGGVYSGATTSTLNITGATAAMNGYIYHVVLTGTCPPPATSSNATLTVVNPVSITAQPAAQAVLCSGSNTSFSVTAASTETITYQWQVSTNAGGSWSNVTNGGVYSGATTTTLSITGATVAMNSYLYRVLLTNVSCTSPTTSSQSLLIVRALPTVGLTASMTSLLPGQLSTLTATPSAPAPGGTQTITWLYNGTASVPPITGNTYIANVEHVGTYQVLIQEAYTGPTLVCSNQSPIVTITAAASSRLFIFPTPNDGRFTVSYFNNGGASTQRNIVIYDSKGSQIYKRKFPITGLYTLINIDLRQVNRGIFYVVVGDVNGQKLAEGKVHIR